MTLRKALLARAGTPEAKAQYGESEASIPLTEQEAEALVTFIQKHDDRFTASSALCTPWRRCPCVVLAQGKTPGGRTRAIVFHRTKDYVAEAEAAAAALRARGRPRVLYVRGPRGQETGLAGSINTEIIEFAGAENVAAGGGLGAGSLAPLSPEQALAWEPDWVIGIHPDFPAHARRDPVWRSLRAVRDGRLALAPSLPYGWVDFPPSVNRLLGLAWLPVLFGARPVEGLPDTVSDLYALLLHRRPEPAQVEALLRPALPFRG